MVVDISNHRHWLKSQLEYDRIKKVLAHVLTLHEASLSSQGNDFCYFDCFSLLGWLAEPDVKNEELEIHMCLSSTIFICKLLSHDRDWDARTVL